MNVVYQRILEMAMPYLNTRKNDVHVREALELVGRLIEEVDADERIVMPAVILHDVGWKMVPEELQLKAFGPADLDEELRRVHEVEGARLAREILTEVGYDEAAIGEIVRIIGGHDSRAEAISLNDKVVKDVDKLTRFGGRWFNTDSERFKIPPTQWANWLEQQIPRWFFTDAARRLAHEVLARKRAEIEANT